MERSESLATSSSSRRSKTYESPEGSVQLSRFATVLQSQSHPALGVCLGSWGHDRGGKPPDDILLGLWRKCELEVLDERRRDGLHLEKGELPTCVPC